MGMYEMDECDYKAMQHEAMQECMEELARLEKREGEGRARGVPDDDVVEESERREYASRCGMSDFYLIEEDNDELVLSGYGYDDYKSSIERQTRYRVGCGVVVRGVSGGVGSVIYSKRVDNMFSAGLLNPMKDAESRRWCETSARLATGLGGVADLGGLAEVGFDYVLHFCGDTGADRFTVVIPISRTPVRMFGAVDEDTSVVQVYGTPEVLDGNEVAQFCVSLVSPLLGCAGDVEVHCFPEERLCELVTKDELDAFFGLPRRERREVA